MLVTVLKPGDKGKGRDEIAPPDRSRVGQERMQHLKAVRHLVHHCPMYFFGGIPMAAV